MGTIKSLAIISILFFAGLAEAVITLPIRVMGADQIIETVTLPVDEPADVHQLWIMTHNLAYENKMAIRVNGGDWVNVNHTTAKLSEKDMTYGGFGGFTNIHKFTIQLSGFVKGNNQIEFKFNKDMSITEGRITQGYRVVRLNLQDAGGNNLVPDSYFINEDPTKWTPILNNAADIEAGRKLFQETMVPDIGVLSCSDCHTKNGDDLKYFAYSDFAIMTSAKLHQFSDKQAQQIASFIRARPIESHGRPWNPPYQPGPQLNGKPIEQWASGAGIDAVLETDDQMHDYLFPNGTSMKEIRKVVDLDSNLDVTELPIAIPLFEWNRWMQSTHPKQVWPNGEFTRGPYQTYLDLRKTLETKLKTDPDYIKSEKFVNSLAKLRNDTKKWIGEGKTNTKDNWRGLDGINLDARDPKYSREEAKLHLMRWVAVRYFELMQEFEIEKNAHLYFGKSPNGEGHRQWPMHERSIFELAPHFLADSIEAFEFMNQPRIEGKMWSSAWYQAQMIVNSGEYGITRRGSPMDWTYHYTHMWEAQVEGAPLEGFRTISSIIEMWQERTNKKMGDDGWRWRYMHPIYLFAPKNSTQENMDMLNTHDSNLRKKLLSAMLEQWIEKLNEFAIADWPRTNKGEKEDWITLKDASHVPKYEIKSLPDDWLWATANQNHADYLYRIIPLLIEYEVDEKVMNDIIDWCEEMWPKGDWSKWKQDVDLAKNATSTTLMFKPSVTISSSKLHIKDLQPGAQIRICDLRGRELLNQNVDTKSFKWNAPSKGMFIVQMVSPEGTQKQNHKITTR